jgi:integrase
MITQRPRSDGTTAYYVTVEYPARDGKRQRRCGTYDKLREAQARERAWKQEAAAGGRPPAQQTLAEYLRAWLAEKEHTVGDTTYANYAEYVEVVIAPRIGLMRLDRLTPGFLQRFINELHASGRKDGTGGLSSSRTNGAYTLLRSALKRAHELGLLPANPMALVRPVRHEAREYPEWDEAHLARFLEAALATPLGPYWVLALVTGMRRGELLGLRWRDLDWERSCLRLRQQVKALRGRAREGNLKSRRPRVVYLGAGTMALLAEHQTNQKTHKIEVRLDWVENDLVFCADDGRPWNPTSLTHMFARLVEQARVPRIKLHLLRAVNASISVAEGADPRTLADRLGHSRPSTTADHYLLRSAGRQRDLAEAVEATIMRRQAPR